VNLSRLLDQLAPITLGSGDSALSLRRSGPPQNPAFDRHLLIDGEPAFHLGNVCGTCEFLFERMGGANRSLTVEEIAGRLKEGVGTIDEQLVVELGTLLPAGRYSTLLLELTPRLIVPGTVEDYFSREQVATWGVSAFWGLPHHPRTEYYRVDTLPVGAGERLFEFVVPMFPHGWLDRERVEDYRAQASSSRPTAVSLSLLDVKQPATWEDSTDVHTHWCLANYLLDGHHKVYAAAQTGAVVNLLAFVWLDESIAEPEQLDRLPGLLTSTAA
jgi:hypothetical protein